MNIKRLGTSFCSVLFYIIHFIVISTVALGYLTLRILKHRVAFSLDQDHSFQAHLLLQMMV